MICLSIADALISVSGSDINKTIYGLTDGQGELIQVLVPSVALYMWN